MTDKQRAIRSAIRSFLMLATPEQLARELEISIEFGDTFRADCIRELMAE